MLSTGPWISGTSLYFNFLTDYSLKTYSFLSVAFFMNKHSMVFMEKRTNHTKGDLKYNPWDTFCHCFITDCFFSSFYGSLWQCRSWLHNVSDIILSPYCELDLPDNWVEDRESSQVFILQNFLWRLPSVEQLWERFQWCTEYISWSYSLKSSDKST